MPVIDVDGVSHAYGEGSNRRVVLSDVSLRLTEQRIGIVGANGSGKSTFVRMLNGLVLPTSGSVRVDGLDTRRAAGRYAVGWGSASPTPTRRS